jgi:hypothetical protein
MRIEPTLTERTRPRQETRMFPPIQPFGFGVERGGRDSQLMHFSAHSHRERSEKKVHCFPVPQSAPQRSFGVSQ